MFAFEKDHPDYRIERKKSGRGWRGWGEKGPLSLIQVKEDPDD